MTTTMPEMLALAERVSRRGEAMTVDEILPLLRPAEKRAILSMNSKCRTCKEIGTTGGVLWELNDFRRDHMGIAPPTMMVWYDEEYGWRGWALTGLGEQVQQALVSAENDHLKGGE